MVLETETSGAAPGVRNYFVFSVKVGSDTTKLGLTFDYYTAGFEF